MMVSPPWARLTSRFAIYLLLASLSVAASSGRGGAKEPEILPRVIRIGTSGSLVTARDPGTEKGALDALRGLVRDRTGFSCRIVPRDGWSALAESMKARQVDLGVFRGYEFAWAQAANPDLKPLALAVNGRRYPRAFTFVRRDSPARTFDDLRGQTLSLADAIPRFVRLYVDRQAQARGSDPETFFSKITGQDNAESALDDVVDGIVAVTVVDQAALEAYRRRKPARFAELKEVDRSRPFPPGVIACYGGHLTSPARQRVQRWLLAVASEERAKAMFILFGISGFDPVPPEFERILEGVRQEYPPLPRQVPRD